MRYTRFQQLVEGGEKANVDFKIRCDAFASQALAPRAELAKDICAMANNGNATSYIIVGVSDDAQSFESVRNANLTDERLQDFCKTAVHPSVRLKVHRERWSRATPDHAGKDFVVIQIGPHARQAFRLSRDFIEYRSGVCYRRNEVWVRRGSICDLATPEEVARLVRGLPPEQQTKPDNNIEYARLARTQRHHAIMTDLRGCLEEVGGSECQHFLAVPVRDTRFVWRCFVVPELTRNSGYSTVSLLQHSGYAHGALVLATGTVSKPALQAGTDILYRRSWGWCAWAPDRMVPRPARSRGPAFKQHPPLPILALGRLVDTQKLRQSFLALLEFVREDDDTLNRMREAREWLNHELTSYLRANRAFLRKYSANTVVPDAKAGADSWTAAQLEVRLQSLQQAQFVLRLSKGKGPR